MDFLNGHDRKLGYLEEPDMVDFLDSSDIFHTPMTHGFPTPEEETNYEHDWLNSFLDDPVLNDRMMTDAMQPCIKSEHSYSINDHHGPGSPLGLSSHEDMDQELFSTSSALDLTMKTESSSSVVEKSEPSSSPTDSFLTSTAIINTHISNNSSHSSSHASTNTNTSTSNLGSLGGQPTIIVTTTTTASATSPFLSGYPSIQIKQEPADCLDQSNEQTVNLDSIVLPPTPPGSSGSDSDGSQSPQAPSSPARQNSVYRTSATSPLGVSSTKALTQPLFVNPISQSGVLILSEEEKRTLISEGYPIPTKLPLTKQEEKNLKKIRRKIKNKISAQESRRKKKEYLEALEKRVEAYNHENSDLKKKVESLENNNRSLLGQLQKLQSLVSKMPKAASATQTSTALMVVVFCFAVFLGSMSPSSLNIGYSNRPPMLGFVQPQVNPLPQQEMGPHPMTVEDTSDPYATPNLKSRMLMSVEQDDYCDDTRSMPWHHAMSCPMGNTDSFEDVVDDLMDDDYVTRKAPGFELPVDSDFFTGKEERAAAMDTTVVMVMASNMENSSDSTNGDKIGTVMPDMSVNPKDMIGEAYQRNMTADLETAA